jgi:phosphoglycolate phosphatase
LTAGGSPSSLAVRHDRSRGNPTFEVAAIAFDLDGTLLDTVHDLAAALNGMLVEIGAAPMATDRVRELIGKGIENLVRRAVTETRTRAPDEGELAALIARYQTLYASALGGQTVVFDGVREGLEGLCAAGFPLAVVTNKASRFVAPHLENAGIAHFFDVIVGGDDALAKKPDAAPMLLVAQRLGIAPARLLMVGDSSNDALCARAAGAPVLIVPYGYNEGVPVGDIDCDGIVASVAAVPDRVQRASARPTSPA